MSNRPAVAPRQLDAVPQVLRGLGAEAAQRPRAARPRWPPAGRRGGRRPAPGRGPSPCAGRAPAPRSAPAPRPGSSPAASRRPGSGRCEVLDDLFRDRRADSWESGAAACRSSVATSTGCPATARAALVYTRALNASPPVIASRSAYSSNSAATASLARATAQSTEAASGYGKAARCAGQRPGRGLSWRGRAVASWVASSPGFAAGRAGTWSRHAAAAPPPARSRSPTWRSGAALVDLTRTLSRVTRDGLRGQRTRPACPGAARRSTTTGCRPTPRRGRCHRCRRRCRAGRPG